MNSIEENYEDALNRIEFLESQMRELKREMEKLKVYIDQVIN